MGIFGRKKTTVGLDIGSGLVKVVVIDHSKAEPELTRVAITPLLADGEMKVKKAAIELLRKIKT